MTLHSDKELFKDTLEVINKDANIYFDILEKDYYVCMILRYISEHQEELQAYFKGGTAVYKILEMHRFSEDIDLTVKVDENITDSQKSKKLKASALKYNLDGTGRKQAIFFERKYRLAFFFNCHEYEVIQIF